MPNWDQWNTHAGQQGISPEAQRQAARWLSPVRHLSDDQFKTVKKKSKPRERKKTS